MKKIPFLVMIVFMLMVNACNLLEKDIEQNNHKLPTGLSAIDDAALGDWDMGVIKDSMYLVIHNDTINNVSYLYINNVYASSWEGIYLQIDDQDRIFGTGIDEMYYSVSMTDAKMQLACMKDGYVEEEVIELDSSISKAQTRANKALSFFQNVADFFKGVKKANEINENYKEGQWGDLVTNICDIAVDKTVDNFFKGLPKANLSLALAPVDMVTGSIEESNKRNATMIYGDSSVEIEEIRKNQNGNLEVYVVVHNAHSIPKYLTRYYEPVENEETRNHVFLGIVGRLEWEPTYRLYDKPYKISEVEIESLDPGKEMHLSFTLPSVPSGVVYKFRPYLKSTRIKNLFGDVDDVFIKYGSVKDYMGIDGTIKSFKQMFAQNTKSDYGSFVDFNCSVTATIGSLDGIEEWGIYVYKLDGYDEYYEIPSEYNAVKLEDQIELELKIDNFDEIDYESFFAAKRILIGLYIKLKNESGLYDYMSKFYGAPQEYELVYKQKPKIEFIDANINPAKDYVSTTGKDQDTSNCYDLLIRLNGTFFMDAIHDLPWSSSPNTWSFEGRDIKDGENFPTGNCVFYKRGDKGDKILPYRFRATLGNGEYYYSINRAEIYSQGGIVYDAIRIVPNQ